MNGIPDDHASDADIQRIVRNGGLAASDDHVSHCDECQEEVQLRRLLARATSIPDSRCLTASDLVASADGTQLGHDELAVRQHLRDCPSCSADHEALLDTDAHELELPGLPAPKLGLLHLLSSELRALLTWQAPAAPILALRSAHVASSSRAEEGMAAYRCQQHEEAARALAEARASEPSAELAFYLGSSLKELGRLDEAASSLAEAASLAPRCAAYHWSLAVVLLELTLPEGALAAFARVASLPGARRKQARIVVDSLTKSLEGRWEC